MANSRTILPEMIGVSNNSPLTREIHQILTQKLEGYDFEVFHRWLQLVERENDTKVRHAKNKFL